MKWKLEYEESKVAKLAKEKAEAENNVRLCWMILAECQCGRTPEQSEDCDEDIVVIGESANK